MIGTLALLQEGMEAPSFAPLLIVTALAAIIPLVSDRLKILPIPVIVGEILAGILLGESGLGIIQESPYLTFLAEFGFVYLMFLSGLEIDFSRAFLEIADPLFCAASISGVWLSAKLQQRCGFAKDQLFCKSL